MEGNNKQVGGGGGAREMPSGWGVDNENNSRSCAGILFCIHNLLPPSNERTLHDSKYKMLQ